MSIWGKILGGAAGLAVAGPLGALIGAVAGHLGIDRDWGEAESDPTRTAAFTIGVIALSAKMAKADGQVTRDEIAAFRTVFTVPEGDATAVGRIFNMAREDVAGFEHYARDLYRLLKDRPGVLEDLLDGLFFIAKADGAIDLKEVAFLAQVADIFGFSEFEFERIKASHLPPDENDPYVVLGLTHDADQDAIKKAYRRLAAENHPDRLIARGVPEEFIEIATEKLKAINAAYEKLRR